MRLNFFLLVLICQILVNMSSVRIFKKPTFNRFLKNKPGHGKILRCSNFKCSGYMNFSKILGLVEPYGSSVLEPRTYVRTYGRNWLEGNYKISD